MVVVGAAVVVGGTVVVIAVVVVVPEPFLGIPQEDSLGSNDCLESFYVIVVRTVEKLVEVPQAPWHGRITLLQFQATFC